MQHWGENLPSGTFYDFLRVVGEEVAERGSLGPLQRVEQLLDLGRHSAADGNPCSQEQSGKVTDQSWHGAVSHTAVTIGLLLFTPPKNLAEWDPSNPTLTPQCYKTRGLVLRWPWLSTGFQG